ncbi:hypothetical protein [Kitasatospora sp. NPDC127116]|uniref:hypothetical protein n=1 Tax=Kitasatospora sp. NPDC127116 TaxID=3345367 RepID=UPI00362E09B8
MKTLIRHCCGHEAIANITGPTATRDNRADWLATQLCPDCARQQRAQTNASENQAATDRARSAGWPVLTGTPKQTAWAESIRADAIDSMSDRLRQGLPGDIADQVLALWTPAALREIRAEWWIDHRAGTVRAVNSCTLTAKERSAINYLISAAGGKP